jgi:tight adherence protein B
MMGVGLLTILVFALVGQAAWLLTDGLASRQPAETPVARRVDEYTSITWDAPVVDASSILRRQRLSRFPFLERILKRLDLGEKLSRDLHGAGLQIQAAEFLFAQLVITTVCGFAAFLALPSLLGGLAPALGAGLLGFLAPMFWLRRARAARLGLFEEELPDALDLIAGSLRAGYSTADAMEIVARETVGPCADEFAEVVQELNLGADMDAVLARLNERVPSEDVRLLVNAIGVQRRTGGNLVDVLKQLAGTLRERRRLRQEVHVLTTGPRVSGYVGAALPFAMLVGMYVINRKSFDILITEPTGRIALMASAVLVVVGLFLNNRIAKVEV